MNVLAEKQKRIFEEGITDEEKNKREQEFLELYYKLRDENDEKIYSRLTLEQRRKIHKLILLIYTIKNKLGGFSYELIKDERIPTDRPIIFALTHVGKFDIEVTSEAIKDHYYLLSGDFEHLQGTIDAPFLGFNGVIYFNEIVKDDRKRASEQMIEHGNNCGNTMYFPEGTWNLSPNLPVLPCYWGIIDVARQSNAIIIPVGVEQYEKHFKINIGKNFDVNDYSEDTLGKTEAIGALRDNLALLKWEIWETGSLYKRSELDVSEWDEYKKDRFKEWPYFNEKYIDRLIFKPKNVTSHEEAFAHVKKLVPNRANAFLYNKRLIGDISE